MANRGWLAAIKPGELMSCSFRRVMIRFVTEKKGCWLIFGLFCWLTGVVVGYACNRGEPFLKKLSMWYSQRTTGPDDKWSQAESRSTRQRLRHCASLSSHRPRMPSFCLFFQARRK